MQLNQISLGKALKQLSRLKVSCQYPMAIESKVKGVINLSHSEPDIFTKDDVNLFRVIADFVGVSLYSSLNYNKIQNSEQNYRALAEYSNNGIAIIQNDMHVYVNPKYKELTGYSLAELQRLSLEKLIDFTYQSADLESMFEDLKNNSRNELFNARVIKKNGSILDVEISASSVLYYDKRTLVISMLDISDRKILERQLIHAQKMQSMGTLAGGIAHNFNNLPNGNPGKYI